MLPVSVNDIVHEKHPTVLQRLDIFKDFFCGAKAVTAAGSPAYRTKVTIKGTAAAGLNCAGEQIHLLFQEIPPRDSVAFHIEQRSTITWLQLSALKVLEQLTPHRF